MPYRRLPNTDQARIRALKTAIEKADGYDNPYGLPFSFRTVGMARNFLPRFEAAHIFYMECFNRQAKAGRIHQANVKMARLYLSHFIQVFNLAVIRSEIRVAHKAYYGLDACPSLPDLSSEQALLEWGRKIIAGENRRTSQGGIPIYNPTIAKVKVHYDIFAESYEKQRGLQTATARSQAAVASMRREADALILDLWNQVEEKFSQVEPVDKRLELCRAYGLVYYYRTSEKIKSGVEP